MSFENIIGNDENKRLLCNSIINKNIVHSYLFYGADGIGKKIFAKEFAKMILCNEKDDKKPCNKCKSCIEFNSDNNPDFFIIEPDGNSIKIDQIRQMQKSVMEKPIESTKKVYIIDNCHLMTKEAQNCMLKTLEEPQEYIVIILIAANENNILSTVKSRCTKIFFKEIDDNEIFKYVGNKYDEVGIENDLIRLCSGSISKADYIISKIDMLNQVKKIINEVDKCNKLHFIQNNQLIYDNKVEIDLLLEYIYILLFQEVMKNNKKSDVYIKSMKTVEKTKIKLQNSNNFDMTIDNMLINIWEEINEKNNRC
ncbi:MAG: DNA polymerase III subunit delta' [Clostridia bacterium]|nr:DNA polymerase III subunit delta' [Clostridia bacterium]